MGSEAWEAGRGAHGESWGHEGALREVFQKGLAILAEKNDPHIILGLYIKAVFLKL